jgi:hypothetical protein
MTEQMTTDAATVVDRYFAALNERDPAERRRLIEAAWSPDGSLTDPPIDGAGHDGVAAIADALHDRFVGHQFWRTTAVDVHHGRYRVAWALVGPGGQTAMTGLDTGVLTEDGRVGDVVGFFGELPPRD